MPKQTVIGIRIIWDHDHGTACEGWYCRLRLSDGQERDESLEGGKRCGLRSLLPQAKAEARAWGWAITRGCPVQLVR